jgi:hypothetical protein
MVTVILIADDLHNICLNIAGRGGCRRCKSCGSFPPGEKADVSRQPTLVDIPRWHTRLERHMSKPPPTSFVASHGGAPVSIAPGVYLPLRSVEETRRRSPPRLHER